MGWWARLREGLNLRPHTTAPLVQESSLRMSGELQAWLQAAFSPQGPSDNESLTLARIKENSVRSAKEIRDVYDQVEEQNFALRWALVYVAGRLEEPVTIDFFEHVLRSPISPERSHDIHLFSSVAEETSLRCTAVDGLASLAAKNVDDALQSLLRQLGHPSFNVRATACLCLRELPGRPISEDDIGRRLPSEEKERILAIRRVSVTQAVAPAEPRAARRLSRPPGGEFGLNSRRSGRRPPRATP